MKISLEGATHTNMYTKPRDGAWGGGGFYIPPGELGGAKFLIVLQVWNLSENLAECSQHLHKPSRL